MVNFIVEYQSVHEVTASCLSLFPPDAKATCTWIVRVRSKQPIIAREVIGGELVNSALGKAQNGKDQATSDFLTHPQRGSNHFQIVRSMSSGD